MVEGRLINMKKSIAILLSLLTLTAGIFIGNQSPTEAASTVPKTIYVDFDKLSTKQENKQIAKRKGKILISRQTGTVTDNKKNGRTKDGYYISYKSVKRVKKGDKIVTVLIWNPNNNSLDDISMRYDYRIVSDKEKLMKLYKFHINKTY